jgi:hypothetical protein
MTADDFFKALDTIENAKYNLDYTHSFKKKTDNLLLYSGQTH